jgi:hypothetical protein
LLEDYLLGLQGREKVRQLVGRDPELLAMALLSTP